MKKLILASLLTISACSSSGGGGDTSKNLFSIWTEQSSGGVIDLQAASFGTPINFSVFFSGGAQCNCDLTFIGGQASGTYILNQCFYIFNSGSADPNCNALNQTGTYSNSNGTLTVLDDQGAVEIYK